MPAKHQPDFIYLRHVPLRKVHLFTVIQMSCLVLLWIIKVSRAAIVFPMMVWNFFFSLPVNFCSYWKPTNWNWNDRVILNSYGKPWYKLEPLKLVTKTGFKVTYELQWFILVLSLSFLMLTVVWIDWIWVEKYKLSKFNFKSTPANLKS